jgi:hypothetical protein
MFRVFLAAHVCHSMCVCVACFLPSPTLSPQDEHGASPWAAAAQQIMAAPLPDGFTFGAARNEFRLLR